MRIVSSIYDHNVANVECIYLSNRKEEIANLAPALPSLAEEEDQIVEFGQTKLHDLAALEGSNLSALIKQNYSTIAARNAESKTPRDIANELNLVDNVRQIGNLKLIQKFKIAKSKLILNN